MIKLIDFELMKIGKNEWRLIRLVPIRNLKLKDENIECGCTYCKKK